VEDAMPVRDTNPPIVRQTDDLVVQIKGLHSAIAKGERDNLRMAIDVGEKLLVLREECLRADPPLPWRKTLANTGVPETTAREYMDMAKAYRPGGICAESAHLGYSESLRYVRKARKEEKEKQKPQDNAVPSPTPPVPQSPTEEPVPEEPISENLACPLCGVDIGAMTYPDGIWYCKYCHCGFDSHGYPLKEAEEEPAVEEPIAENPIEETIEEEPATEEPVAEKPSTPKTPRKPNRIPLPEAKPEVSSASKSSYVTIPMWEEMSAKQRNDCLATVGKATFNTQTGDSIEWAQWSWNPVTGCLHDCPYCYARDIANRFYEQGFEPSLNPNRITAPRNQSLPTSRIDALPDGDWEKVALRNVFTCSMADLFGRWVPREWIETVLAECRDAEQWNFLFLTKFPNRMSEFEFPDNCWVGTTVDCQTRVKNAERAFRKVKARVKWLSCEPLLEPLKFTDLGAFQWVVIGGASASSQTPVWNPPLDWTMDLVKTARANGVKCFVKSNCRLRQYPWLDDSTSAPDSLIYLPQEIG
jgi:protein gp37